MKKIKLDSIRIDGDTQGRLVIDQSKVYEYRDKMLEGVELPNVFAVFDGAAYWLVDGFHRYHAYRLLGLKEVVVNYKPGTLEEAQVLSFGVNGAHGKPRTNEDKRNVVEKALVHPLTKHKSDNEIAKICDVSHPFVAAVRDPEVKARQTKNRDKSMEKKVAEKKPARVESDSTFVAEKPVSEQSSGEAPDDAEIKAAEMALQADTEAMYKLLEADEPLRMAHEEIKRLNLRVAQQETRLHGLMNEKNAAVKMVKELQKQLDKLKAQK